MLRPTRDVINNLIELITPYKSNLLSAYCVGFSNYDTIQLSFIFDCDLTLKKIKSFGEANINWFDIRKVCDKTILQMKIYVTPRKNPCF